MGVKNHQAFKPQNATEFNKTFDLLVSSNSVLKKCFFSQLYGNMCLGNYGSIWTIDHCYPLSKTNLFIEMDMFISTTWINLRTMFLNENSSKGANINHQLYLVQEIKANHFMRLND